MRERERSRRILVMLIGMFSGLLTGVCLQTAYAEGQQGTVVIIGNKNLPESSLSKTDIQNIFLGKKTKVDSTNITCVILKSGEVHENFLKGYLARTSSQYEQYWKKVVFSGQGKAPKVFETEETLIEYVKNTEGAIGYIGAATAQKIESGSLRQFVVQ